jgi:UDP-N-acetylmuramoyl-L-alanyl-D-glutamate--2,6-diaminopimelate ligase
MLLSDLFPSESRLTATHDAAATAVTADSRHVAPGTVFVAIKGAMLDGHDFIDDALKAGAAAIVAETSHPTGDVPLIITDNSRLSLTQIAAAIACDQPAVIVAITGTNGKTSVADFLRQIWAFIGWSSASIGTLGIKGSGLGRFAQTADLSNLTTPDAVNFHNCLADMAKAGVTNLAVEASSHGIEQDRLSSLHLVAAGFTNLSRDHLDYHQDMENYFAAKERLFTEILPDGGMAVINIDDDYGKQLVKSLKRRAVGVLTIGRTNKADLQINDISAHDGGLTVTASFDGVTRTIPLALMGGFQAENALMAAGLAYGAGLSMAHAMLALPYLIAPQGRMQMITPPPPNGGKVVVDFAHTPDALATALVALKADTKGKLSVVFGCGGERDDGKRAEMGAIAHDHADFTIITDDNPRGEDPAAIRKMILDACPNAKEIGDRHKAIRHGITSLNDGDILLIAGKGHESNQLVGSETLPFSDEAEAAAIISSLRAEA